MKIIVECVRPQNDFARFVRCWLRFPLDLLFKAGNLVPSSPLLKTDVSKPGKLPLWRQPQHFPDQVRETRCVAEKVRDPGRMRAPLRPLINPSESISVERPPFAFGVVRDKLPSLSRIINVRRTFRLTPLAL